MAIVNWKRQHKLTLTIAIWDCYLFLLFDVILREYFFLIIQDKFIVVHVYPIIVDIIC